MKIQEKTRSVASGYLALVVLPVLTLLLGWLLVGAVKAADATFIVIYGILALAVFICYFGFFMVHPNQAIAEKLREEVQDRLDKAGVEVIEARISHLAYAQEIASAMLKRQQAQAIVAARRQIVDGAVGMVQMALSELDEQGVVELDEERKASMVSNLLVVLCGEENARPVVNTGSLYS